MTHMNAAALLARYAHATAEGLNAAAERVKAVTIPLTPKDEGDLRSSIQVDPATDGTLRASLGSDSPYAVPQHEHLEYRHELGQAKFLEVATRKEAPNVGRIVGEHVRRGIVGGKP